MGYTCSSVQLILTLWHSEEGRIVDLIFGCLFFRPIHGNDQRKGVLDRQCRRQHIAARYGQFGPTGIEKNGTQPT